MSEQKSLDILDAATSVTDLRILLGDRNPAFSVAVMKSVIIVGAADEGMRVASFCREKGIEIVAICDDDPTKLGAEAEGCKVISVSDLEEQSKETPVLIASHRALKVQRRLREMGFVNVAPLAVIEAMDPDSFSPHMFYDGLFEDLFDNRDQYRALNDILADDFSRRVLDRVLAYRLTLDAEVLAPIVEWELYAPKDLFDYSDDEVYVDGGAFDGDSIRLFIERVKGNFSRVIGFEPDSGTFQYLKANFADEPRVELINKGLHRCEATLNFDNAGTRGSIITEETQSGSVEIPVVGLDDVLKGDRVSFIKMNIEGAELEALRGSRKSIAKWHPRLAISGYHRPTDLWQIPALIRDLDPHYKLYLRQHDGGVIETVVYALTEERSVSR